MQFIALLIGFQNEREFPSNGKTFKTGDALCQIGESTHAFRLSAKLYEELKQLPINTAIQIVVGFSSNMNQTSGLVYTSAKIENFTRLVAAAPNYSVQQAEPMATVPQSEPTDGDLPF